MAVESIDCATFDREYDPDTRSSNPTVARLGCGACSNAVYLRETDSWIKRRLFDEAIREVGDAGGLPISIRNGIACYSNFDGRAYYRCAGGICPNSENLKAALELLKEQIGGEF